MEFLRLFALAQDSWVTKRDCWDGMWNLILEGALSDQRAEDFLCMQSPLISIRSRRVHDGWVLGVYI